MTPEQLKRCAFVMRGLAAINDWVETLDETAKGRPIVCIELDFRSEDDQESSCYDPTISLDRAYLKSMLLHLQKVSTDELRAAGIEIDEKSEPACCCQNPEPASGPALISNECPIHNDVPQERPV